MDMVLRDVTPDDLPALFQHQIDPVATRMAAFEPRDEAAFMAHWQDRILADPAVIKKAVVVDGRIAGNVVSFVRAGRREVGYWIAREHWGKGVATEALSRLLAEVTERPLYAVVAAHNVASVRVLEKCGFEVESRRRGSPGERGPAVDELVMRLRAAR